MLLQLRLTSKLSTRCQAILPTLPGRLIDLIPIKHVCALGYEHVMECSISDHRFHGERKILEGIGLKNEKWKSSLGIPECIIACVL